MNKVNYLALGAVALTIFSIFSPWVEVFDVDIPSDLSGGFQPAIVNGISIGYGIFGMLVVLIGVFLVFKEFKWTFVAGIVNFIDGYGYLHKWFGAGTHDSGNYGDVTSKSSVDPKFGIYLFIVASLAFIIFTIKYFRSKKAISLLPSVPVIKENPEFAFATKATMPSQVYKPSKIQTMTTSSTETPLEPASAETPKEPVQPNEAATEQSAATPTAEEAQVENITASAQPVETPKEPAKVVISEPVPVYQAPKEITTPQQPYVEPEKKKSSTTKILLIILAFVIVGAGVFVLTNTTSEKSKDKTEQSINDEKARLEIIINEVNQAVSDKKYDDALLKINSINWLYDPTSNKGYVDQYNSQRENLRNTIEQLKSNQSLEDQKHATEKANESSQPIQSSDSIH